MHWGTFSLSTHAWDQPAEVLFEKATKAGVQLVMPHLGEPVEPSRLEGVVPWWRAVDGKSIVPAPQPEITLPKAMPWPID